MKLKIVIALALVSGFAQAAEQIDIPVKVSTIKAAAVTDPRWEEFLGVQHDESADLIAAGQRAGGACHELSTKGTVVCYFPESLPKQVGIDWGKVNPAQAGH